MFQLRWILTASLAIAVIGCLSCYSSAQNVLLNPGFELGTGGDADDWEEFGGPAGSTDRNNSLPNSGDFHALMTVDHVNNFPAAVPYFIQQVLPVGSIDNTLNYDLSFSARVDTLDFEGIDIFYQIQWLDQDASDGGGVQGEELVSLIGEGISTEYQSFGLDDLDVPDGADSVLVRFQLSPGPIPDIANSLFVDDASLTVNGAAPLLAGDYNSNGIVDAADYTVWRDNLGAPAGTLANDTDGGAISTAQYLTWQTNFAATASGQTSVIAAPEPTSLGLLSVMALTCIGHRREPRAG